MFRGEKIQLAAVQREYLPKYVEWLNDWEIAQFLDPGIPAPFNLEDETAWFENRSKSKDSSVFAILTLAENKLIGNCGIHNIDFKNRKGVFGIFIGDYLSDLVPSLERVLSTVEFSFLSQSLRLPTGSLSDAGSRLLVRER